MQQSNKKEKEKPFFDHFQSILKQMNAISTNESQFFSELDMINQKPGEQQQQQFEISDFDDSTIPQDNEMTYQLKERVDQYSHCAIQNQTENQDNEEQIQQQMIIPSNQKEEAVQQAEQATSIENIKPIQTETCKCTNSKCLKLYCMCFSNGIFCSPSCKCSQCCNTLEKESEVKEARKNTLNKNPIAFNSKVEVVVSGNIYANEISNTDGSKAMLGYRKGCKCKKTFCKKKYCECFNAGVKCSYLCICEECQNKEEDQNNDKKPQDQKRNKKRSLEILNEDQQEINGSQINYAQDIDEQSLVSTLRKKIKTLEDGETSYHHDASFTNFEIQTEEHQDEKKQQQIIYNFDTPTFKQFDRQFDPNSVYKIKNENNSNFSLDS